eukprot:188633-Prorocentrum_minimum.AAC.1
MERTDSRRLSLPWGIHQRERGIHQRARGIHRRERGIHRRLSPPPLVVEGQRQREQHACSKHTQRGPQSHSAAIPTAMPAVRSTRSACEPTIPLWAPHVGRCDRPSRSGERM